MLDTSARLSGCSGSSSSGELHPACSSDPIDRSWLLLARLAELAAVGVTDSGMASNGGGIATGGNLKKGATRWKGPGCRRPDTYALHKDTATNSG